MKTYNIAILGATGAVGREMLKVLYERKFPVGTIKALASASSAGKKVPFGDRELIIEEATEKSFEGMDFVLGAVSNAMSKKFAPAVVKAGALYIDNSSAFRLDPEVPLVVPEINPEDAYQNKGVIANPNCSTIITLVAVSAIRRLTEIEAMSACTYQAVSGAGREGIEELEAQIKAEVTGEEKVNKIFPCQILSNAIPRIGDELENGYTTEEMKLQNEGRKILHLPELKVCCTCVRIPVKRSHSISVQMKTKDALTIEEVKEAIKNAPGCVLAEDVKGRNYPTPLDTTDQDLVYVGRVRRDLLNGDNGIALWCCGDQVRKGAATNAVQIAEIFARQ
ncbi:MAG: aspartate-semialdehyde dehydrogenase [Clostridia bacterium]|nr:aspartate-semialdehyde dehydrogenase [Clostridia bacterium]MBQ4157453.1 aspartate-semialdehyde dehydrogenase [Clostridia bacterium]